jgi:hypothetical protein
MTFLPHIHRTRFVSTVAALATALAVFLSAAQPASSHHWSPDAFGDWSSAAQIGIDAWQEYLGHCSQISIWGYDNAEEPDYADAYAFAPIQGCDVYFNVDQPKNYKWKWFCSVMVHEIGHSAGMQHIPDEGDIMSGPTEVYWRSCLTKKQAKKMKKHGKIIDRSIYSWYYAKASAAHAGHDDGAAGDEITQAEVDQAIESGDLEVEPIATIPVR